MPVDIQGLPKKIKKNPYWRVTFRPTKYETRIHEGPKAAFGLVQQTQIRLRGWPYPFISDERDEQIRDQKYIASGSEYLGHIEYWRLYYSGQFINLFTVRERTNQRWDESLRKQAQQWIFRPEKPDLSDIPGFIDIINLLYHFTEFFEFATRLCSKGLYDSNLEIAIELRNIERFGLIAEFPRVWHSYYPATVDTVAKSRVIPSEQLLAKSAELALNEAIYFFSQFGWDNPPTDILKQDQEKFLFGKV